MRVRTPRVNIASRIIRFIIGWFSMYSLIIEAPIL
uniref:Uncharacterized protein n=1 Tax=Ciona intestinalis TaxID=7719 RepID=H2XRP6_CIOIN